VSDRPDSYATPDTRIDLADAYDVMLWGLVLGVSPATVAALTAEVGADALRVQAALGATVAVTKEPSKRI
jgi:hypothetical protein